MLHQNDAPGARLSLKVGGPIFAADKRYKKCPKCKGDGVQVSKALRIYAQCTQCSGSGWKYVGDQ